jgi:small-conductance mechanosensitive channel
VLDQNLWLSLQGTLDKILPLVINSILALVLLLIGLVVARILQWLVSTILRLLAFDAGSKKIGFTDILKKGDVEDPPSIIIAALCFWFVVIITTIVVLDAFGVKGTQGLLAKVLAYIYKVLAATVVLAVAIFLATVLQTVVLVAAKAVGLAGAKILSRIVQYAIVIFAFLVALNQLGFDLKWIVESINLIVGAVGLGVAIAFGLGCKDIAGDFLSNFFRNR